KICANSIPTPVVPSYAVPLESAYICHLPVHGVRHCGIFPDYLCGRARAGGRVRLLGLNGVLLYIEGGSASVGADFNRFSGYGSGTAEGMRSGTEVGKNAHFRASAGPSGGFAARVSWHAEFLKKC